MPLPTPVREQQVSYRHLCIHRHAGMWQSPGLKSSRSPAGCCGAGSAGCVPAPEASLHLGLGDLVAPRRVGAVYCKGNKDFLNASRPSRALERGYGSKR